MGIKIINQQKVHGIDLGMKRLMGRLVRKALADAGVKNFEVCLVFVDDAAIQKLNRQFRNQDKPTDVLSFLLEEDQLVGDIIVNVARAQKQAREFGHSLPRELAFLTVHGIYHLLGYDHQTQKEKNEMRAKEEGLLAAYNLQRDVK